MKRVDITPQELCERLFKGEDFYALNGARLFANDSGFFKDRGKGVVDRTNINVWICGDIYTKPHWTDNLSEENPVLCWVWHSSSNRSVAMVARKGRGCFITVSGCRWTNAEPVKLEEACIWTGELS